MNRNNILGVSTGHDAALSVIDGNTGEILFAGHSDRYSKKKHDGYLATEIINEALSYGTIKSVAYFERPWLKKMSDIYFKKNTDQSFFLKSHLQKLFQSHLEFINNVSISCYGHHKSHAAAGFQTSPFDEATVVVIDEIGEFDTVTIWSAYYSDNKAIYKLKYRQLYPNSIGMFYSKMTTKLGLKHFDEEYILMGMSAFGNASNGIPFELINPGLDSESKFDIAAVTQNIIEGEICNIIEKSKSFNSKNLVYTGGVALNCLANRHLGSYYDNIWIMPNPGNAGSSLGAAGLLYGGKIIWNNAFLGHNIEGEYPVEKAIACLLDQKIVGVANGKVEFSPRSLGNRSLFADPRCMNSKNKMSMLKDRQEFRPFSPIVLEENVNKYFEIPAGFEHNEYMQVVASCKTPNQFPSIIHHDLTSRIQIVPKNNTGVRKLLELWYEKTGCPMLLNTDLNVRGQPLVNDEKDAMDFEFDYNIKVFTKK